MDAPLGTVTSVHDGIASVSVDSGACPRCAAGRGCGAGLAGSTTRRQIRVPLDASMGVRAGDRVRLSLASGSLWRAAAYAYGLPLAGLVLTPGAAWWLGLVEGDRQAVLLALIGVAAGAWAGRLMLARDACLQRLAPVIAGRVAADDGR